LKSFGGVVFKGGEKENRIYIIIAIIILVVIILSVFFSSNTINKAFIDDSILGSLWYEDIEERTDKSQLFGLENIASFTYRNDNQTYPAYVTVTSIKLIFMMNEDDLLKTTEETLNDASEQGIIIEENTKKSGVRELVNGHKTTFIMCNGTDYSKEPSERLKIIGESWNCGSSGTSIICIGVAQITDKKNSDSKVDTTFWDEIIDEKNGLISYVSCH
jgi:hypothetical protein